MTAVPSSPDDLSTRTEEFIRAFFGVGNVVWPDQNPDSTAGRRLLPYLQVLRGHSEVPVVLPRRVDVASELTAYVIAFDAAHAAMAAELLTAFVGPSFSYFNGLSTDLDTEDPVDRAVHHFVGPGRTFKVTSPTRSSQARAWDELDRMQATMKLRPVRSWYAPKPVGRLLAEFEVALAAGGNSASAGLLEQLTASGGLSAANLAHLRIKRLARLGRDGELLRLPGLADVVIAGPPRPVRDAILAAVYTSVLAEPLAADDVFLARDRLIDAGTLVPPLLADGLAGFSPESLTVAALTALIRDDAVMLCELRGDCRHRDAVASLAPAVAMAAGITAASEPADSGPLAEPEQQATEAPQAVALASWPELIQAAAAGLGTADAALASQAWRDWAAPVADDDIIASRLAELDDQAAERAWSVVGPFVDADGYQQPAAKAARELIDNALAHDRFSPGDLAGLVALTEIVLRSAPGKQAYSELLDDLGAECGRWAGPDRATVVLDLVDLLASAACPDEEARLRLVIALLRPLHDHSARLESDQARFASQLGYELGTGLEWPTVDDLDQDQALTELSSSKVLLYSLDEGVLKRTETVLGTLVPGIDVKLSHDHVGSARLRSVVRGVDVIVMATRCATHAATGFIRANASAGALVTEADGSGSASLLRAGIAALRARRTR